MSNFYQRSNEPSVAASCCPNFRKGDSGVYLKWNHASNPSQTWDAVSWQFQKSKWDFVRQVDPWHPSVACLRHFKRHNGLCCKSKIIVQTRGYFGRRTKTLIWAQHQSNKVKPQWNFIRNRAGKLWGGCESRYWFNRSQRHLCCKPRPQFAKAILSVRSHHADRLAAA